MQQVNDRQEQILEAACRVIARDGVHGLRMGDVAREAGVSHALVHYYFSTRQELLIRAFEAADTRADVRLAQEAALADGPLDRLTRMLALELVDESMLHESWVPWNEMWNAATRDASLRPAVWRTYARWTDTIERLVRESQAQGLWAVEADAATVAIRLSSIVDGLGNKILIGMMTPEQARALLAGAIDLERGLGVAEARDVAR